MTGLDFLLFYKRKLVCGTLSSKDRNDLGAIKTFINQQFLRLKYSINYIDTYETLNKRAKKHLVPCNCQVKFCLAAFL